MKRILLITSIFISSVLAAQTTTTVTVANFSFTSNNITITVGDTVLFDNTAGGFHFVDGTQATFATNPVSFDNSGSEGGAWVYKQVFNMVGTYAYRCGIHTTSMFGAITVQTATGINDNVKSKTIGFYPNPASKELSFSGINELNRVEIYSLTGKKVLVSDLLTQKMDISTLSSGAYFVKMITENKEITKKLIIQ